MKTLLFLILTLLLAQRIVNPTFNQPLKIEASQLEIDGNKTYEDRIIEFDRVEKLKSEEFERVKALANLNYCDLSFVSEKDGTTVTPPSSFVTRIKDYSCHDKKVLSRLAYYESNFDINARNGYFLSLYQLGSGDTRDFCASNGANSSDEQCALFLYNYDRIDQFETVKVYFDSFNF